MQPGIYRGISNSDYHNGPGTSKSGFDLVRKQPAKFRAAQLAAAEGNRKAPTPSQARGTALHALVLEPELFAESYALPFIPPAGSLRTIEDLKAALTEAGVAFKQSANKGALEALVRESIPDAVLLSDARAAYDAENEGRQELTPEVWDQIHRMRDAVMAHPKARKLLRSPGEAELSAYWHQPVVDPHTGEQAVDAEGNPVTVLCRIRPDYWRHDGILIDLKSTSSGGAAKEEFARSIDSWRYYVQHAVYLNGAAAALEAAQSNELSALANRQYSTPRAFVFIAVEDDADVVDGVAMGVGVYELGEDSVALGLAEFREDVHTFHACTASNRWPGYSDQVERIELPPYAFTKAAARMGAAA